MYTTSFPLLLQTLLAEEVMPFVLIINTTGPAGSVDQAAQVKSPFKQVPSPRKPSLWVGGSLLNFGQSYFG